jgi:hypothetical protein
MDEKALLRVIHGLVDLELKVKKLEKRIQKLEHPEETDLPDWVTPWLDEVEKAGKMPELLALAKEIFPDGY